MRQLHWAIPLVFAVLLLCLVLPVITQAANQLGGGVP